MGMMRKWMALLLACMLLASLVGCGGGESPESVLSSSESADVESTTAAKTTTTTASDATSGGTTTRSKVNVMTSSKVSTTTTTTTTKKPTAPKKPLGMTVGGVKNILCWGDSITAGMGMKQGERYPDVLQSYLGDGYKVWNGGNSGDSSHAVMARQGALSLTTKETITFGAGVSEVKIGQSKKTFNLMLSNGKELQKLNVQENTTSTNPALLHFNPLTISGKSYQMGFSFEGQTPSSGYNVLLSRKDASAAVTVPAGTAVTMASADKSDTSYCEIIHMGANDSIGTEPVSALVERYQAMIDRMPHECYMVIVPYWAAGRYDTVFKEAFGDKAINVVEEIGKRGLSELGLTLTAEDQAKIENKLMPVSLQYKTHDGYHLNEHGYKMVGTLVYERGKKLGYWK